MGLLPSLHVFLTIPLGLAAIAAIAPGGTKTNPKQSVWNPGLAASYLDSRTLAWKTGGAMDHGSFCISCHTALPFALARSRLHRWTHESEPSAVERLLIDDVRLRSSLSSEVQPYLGDKIGGVGTESVLNALILARKAASDGRLDLTTKSALHTMWATQIKSGNDAGSWPWISAGNEPWEAPDSNYWGATLAAVAAGTAPENYLASGPIQSDLQLLKQFLRTNRKGRSLFNKLGLLEASQWVPNLIPLQDQTEIIADAMAKQQSDGGWSTFSLIPPDWARHDGSKQSTLSDGYGTGYVTYNLIQAGVPRSNPQLKRALKWLTENQDPLTGAWITVSPNTTRSFSTDVGKFMTDAATAYAVLALTGRENDKG